MSRFKLLKGARIVATADTLPEAEEYAKKHGCRVMQDAARANPSSGAKQRPRGTREDAGEGAGASLGWAAHYRQAAKRYKADPTEGDAAAAIEHHRQELEAVRQRYPSSRLPGSRSNPSKRDPDHDPKFWAGEWIGEIVNQIRDKASNVYYDEDFSSLEFDGRACSLGYDDKGAILVTKLSFDADDNMKEKRLKFGPSKSVEDGEKIVAKAVAAILARDNPSASEHAEFAKSDLTRARHHNASAKFAIADRDRFAYAMDAHGEAQLAMREARHARDSHLYHEGEGEDAFAGGILHDLALKYLERPGNEYRRNPGRGPDVSRHSAALRDLAEGGVVRKNPARRPVKGTWTDDRLVKVDSAKAKRIASVGGVEVAGWTGTKSSDLEFEAAVRSLIAHNHPDLHRPNIIDIEAAK